ncbi:MAG: nitroreductase family protein, partial [Muribaculaceae bacterium]|nr:nitroreductase family protein [Muribaculaceae bacterium]
MEINDYWTSRRTVRRYTDRHVSDELLNTMLEQAAHAPTTGNMQLYSVIVSRSEEEKKALAPAHFNQPQVTGCDVVLTFCADLNRFTRWCEERDADPCYDNLQSLVAAVLDTAFFAQQFNTIAELNGLGCCMLGTTTYNADM